jgi:hypothetical protein
MKMPLFGFLNKGEPDQPAHPVESKMAKYHIKRRLARLFPELRNNPRALEEAYQALSLEPCEAADPNDPVSAYEVRCTIF